MRKLQMTLCRLAMTLPVVVLFAGVAAAQDKPTVAPSDYGKWENVGSPVLSADGAWLVYPIRHVDGSRELRLRSLQAGSDERVIEWGERPEFAADNRRVAWLVGVSEAERERLTQAKEPVRNDAAVLQLGSAEAKTYKAVRGLGFDATGRYLSLLGYAPDEPRGKGADLRVLDLERGTAITFGNVAEGEWSDTGSMLAFVVATGADEGNGVQLYDASSGALTALDSSGSAYEGLAWREDAVDLAVYRSVEAASASGTAYDVVAWRNLDDRSAMPVTLGTGVAGLADDREIVQHASLEWSDDGATLAVGLRPREVEDADEESEDVEAADTDDGEADAEASAEEEDEEPDLPGVQIWHTSDVRLYAEQKVAEQRDARRTLLAVWHLDAMTLVPIASDLMERSELLGGWTHGVERVSAPYAWGTMFGRPYHDVWLVDATTGARDRVLEQVRQSWSSAGGAYLLSFDGEDYWSYRVSDGTRTNLTASLDTEFQDSEWDTPTDQLPPFGVGGWLTDDEAVLLYDEFDVWEVDPDGTAARRITDGAADELIHRVTRIDPEFGFFSNEPLAADEPIYLTLRNERTEQRGYGWLPVGADHAETLLLEDQFPNQLRKAAEADVLLYLAQARDDSPDFFVAGPDLSAPRQVTETNPWQDDYAWTRSELVDFESESGRPLQAALLYPANYDPTQRYPMIVYTYEILAPQIHFYQAPDERSYYNFTAWTQNGYFVLMPDIVYTWREPGRSAIESVRAAVQTIVDRGLVDAARVGLIGHSWGGYQAAYLPTRTDTFAASVAGAPLTDFVSFMGQLHWSPGIAELSHWETGQARMEVPYWEDPEAHHRSSPIHKVQDMETPLLMAFGNEDGVVDWDQGTEFYNFARRAGKQMVLLVYEGENHGFRTEANQVDYHRRILEWFGHYLKGDPAPAWITEGVPVDLLEKEKRRVATRGRSEQ